MREKTELSAGTLATSELATSAQQSQLMEAQRLLNEKERQLAEERAQLTRERTRAAQPCQQCAEYRAIISTLRQTQAQLTVDHFRKGHPDR